MKRKCYAIYYSPTGTTRKIVEGIIQGLNMESTHVNLTHVQEESQLETITDTQTFAIIATPVYGGQIAPTALARMAHLRGDGIQTLLVVVYGNRAYENALEQLAQFVKERGFTPIGGAAFIGEHSYSTQKYPIAAGRPDAEDLQKAQSLGVQIQKHLDKFKEVNLALLDSPIQPKEKLEKFSLFIQSYKKNTSAKNYPSAPKENCIQCGKCVNICPVNAIRQGMEWETNTSVCTRCCACVKICPTNARTFESPFAPILSEVFSERKEPCWILPDTE